MDRALLPDEDFDTLTSVEKLQDILNRMYLIQKLETTRFWRERFATKEQYAEEYPESYSKDLAISFRLIKDNYTKHYDDINDVAKQIGDNDYFRILKNIVEKDIEDILLSPEEEENEGQEV